MSSPIFNAVVVTVGIDALTAESIIRTVERMPWLVSSAVLNGQISDARKPYLGPATKTANALIGFVDFDEDADEAVQSVEYLKKTFADRITIVALAGEQAPELLLRAMRAGCSEFLEKPLKLENIGVTLARVDYQRANSGDAKKELAQVISFCGVKGGVGTTTLAVHLAIHLSQQHGKRVLLIDAHPALGHACVYLGIDGSRYHFNEVVRSVNRLDSELLRGFVAKHTSGVDVLSSPDRRTSASVLEPDSITRTLEFLRSEYDYVLIDCDVPVTPDSVAIVESSNVVYLVATPDVGAVRDLARYMEILTQADGGAENVQVVLNRVGSRYAIDPVQIEKAMGHSIDIRLPNCFADLIRSGNRGEPISPKQDKSDFTDKFAKWTSDLVGASAPVKPKKEAKKFALWK